MSRLTLGCIYSRRWKLALMFLSSTSPRWLCWTNTEIQNQQPAEAALNHIITKCWNATTRKCENGSLMRSLRTFQFPIKSVFSSLLSCLLSDSQLLGRWKKPCRTVRIWWGFWLMQELQGIGLFVMLSTLCLKLHFPFKVSIHESVFFFLW